MKFSPNLRLVVTDIDNAADYVARWVGDVLQKPSPVLGLATGSSMEPVYDQLRPLVARDPQLRACAARATAFALDEYVGVNRAQPQSYWNTLETQIAGPIGIPLERLHVP